MVPCLTLPISALSADKFLRGRQLEHFIQSQKRLHLSPQCHSHTPCKSSKEKWGCSTCQDAALYFQRLFVTCCALTQFPVHGYEFYRESSHVAISRKEKRRKIPAEKTYQDAKRAKSSEENNPET